MESIDITSVSKLKHADLWSAAKRLGSQSALARAIGVTPSELGTWINLQDFPRRKFDRHGNPNRSDEYFENLDALLRIHTGKGLDELFPEELRTAEDFLKANKTIERTASLPVRALLEYADHSRQRLTYDQGAVDSAIDNSNLKERISKVLKTLSYREREIIKLRYGLDDGHSYTLEEVGHIFKSTRERIRQIEAKAIRKLQQPARSQELVGFLDEEDEEGAKPSGSS